MPCVLYMPRAQGPQHTVTITEKNDEENLSSGVCEQHRRRPASAQSVQRLCYLLFGKYHM